LSSGREKAGKIHVREEAGDNLLSLSRLLVVRMLATGSVVMAATAFRVGASCVDLLAGRTPPLVRLAIGSLTCPSDLGEAQAVFRDELLALMRESAEASWREMRRGVEDFDAFTRPEDGAERAPGRPYRVKP
jgi:hypothetical protein